MNPIYTKYQIPKSKLRQNPQLNLKQLEQEIITTAINNIKKEMKDENITEQDIENFIKTYIQFEITTEYSIQEKEYKLFITPRLNEEMFNTLTNNTNKIIKEST